MFAILGLIMGASAVVIAAALIFGFYIACCLFLCFFKWYLDEPELTDAEKEEKYKHNPYYYHRTSWDH